MLSRGVGVVMVLVASVARAHAAPVTVFLDRHGQVRDDGVEIPRFGGGDRTWNAVVACVREHYAPFAVDIVDEQPARGHYITAVIGGRASQLGLDDDSTNGVGEYNGGVQRDAVVYVFSRVGTGERDVDNLCAVTAHEVGHALGLDHEYYCGDIMSYFLDRCGKRRFIDADARCGEGARRDCSNGEATQNSYRRLGELVGFRDGAGAAPVDPYRDDDPSDVDRSSVDPTPVDPYTEDPGDPTIERFDDDTPAPPPPRQHRTRRSHHHCQSRNVSRNSVFLNFPADVRGIDSTNTNASGNQNFWKRGARKLRRSSAVHVAPGRKTTAARGRSLHRG
jgi:hypothetical protein